MRILFSPLAYCLAIAWIACGLLPRESWAQSPIASEPQVITTPDQSLRDHWDKQLESKFRRKIFPLLTHPEKGCVDCHRTEGTSQLILTGDARQDLQTLLDEQYLKSKGVDTLLKRVLTTHDAKRMPKDGTPWSPRDIQKLKTFLHFVEDTDAYRGAADERFPSSLLEPYPAKSSAAPSDNQFLSYWQLRNKIRILFEDDWVRGDRDLFAENIALFGGADFKTRFNESQQASATFLTGIEMLSRDVAQQAFDQKRGPFRGWNISTDPLTTESTSTYRDAIQQLYQHVLYRPATSSEIDSALNLLQNIFALDEVIRARDEELVFQLTITDPQTQWTDTSVIRIPVSGDPLQVRQVLLDQKTPQPEAPASESTQAPSPRSMRRHLLDPITLHPQVESQRLVLHNIHTQRNVSFAGLRIYRDGKPIQSIPVDASQVEIEGAWQLVEADGFKSYEDKNQHKGQSSIRVHLNVEQEGEYQIEYLWRADPRNDDKVLVEIFSPKAGNRLASPPLPSIPPLGEAHFAFDCSNDAEPFVSPKAIFQFSDQDAVEISNRGTLDTVTAGAIEFVDSKSDQIAFMIDSKEAQGNEAWERYDEGRFKAYNVKGTKVHDNNQHKGERSLVYQPVLKKEQGWTPEASYRLRVYYPGKKDQEIQTPLHIRATSSSPITQISYPSLGKSDAFIRIDASRSYTTDHHPLQFTWKQISGPTILHLDEHASSLEFAVPRRKAHDVAWTSLCAALLRHPDFLFVRPPSLDVQETQGARDRLRLVKIALDLVGRPPTHQECEQLVQGASLESLIDQYLDSQEFRDFYFHRIRLYLESQGTEVQDEPVRLWCYVAFQNRPFQEILTADYTVNAQMEKVSRPPHHGKTGVLTTPGFIQGKPGLPHYNYAAQVAMLFLGFVFEVPPDIVELREGITALGTTDPNSVCYSCHKILTPLAFQRLNWDDDGNFRLKNDDGLPIDASDQQVSEDYPFPGNGLEAFATQAVRKERFFRTMFNTHVHFFFGRPMRFREDERVLYKRLWEDTHASNFTIRSLIRSIVTSPEYLQSQALGRESVPRLSIPSSPSTAR